MSQIDQGSNTEMPATKTAQEPTSSSKKKYEWVWKLIFLAVIGIGGVLFNKVYIFQTHAEFAGIPQGTIWQMLMYGLPFSFVFSVLDWLIHHYFDDVFFNHYITEERYLDTESRKKRCYTLVKWGYSIIYYLITSVWAYKIMVGTSFMPTWLGGHGDPYRLADQSPALSEANLQMQIFYIFQFGKHFSRFFGHIFIRPEGNFFEYALHHGLSIFLILFSYLTNQWIIGIFVLLIHDYSDFALIMARFYKDYKHRSKKLLDVIYVHAFIGWIGCRIILFLSVCIIPSIYCYLNFNWSRLTPFTIEVLDFCYIFMIIMMCCLEVLHIFWTYYIAESFVAIRVSSKLATHSYD